MGLPSDHGLHTSMWASRFPQDRSRPATATISDDPVPMTTNIFPGDWICPSCGLLDCARRAGYFRCEAAHPYDGDQAHTEPESMQSHPPKTLAASSLPTDAVSTSMGDDEALRYPAKFLTELKNGKRGLANSQFAPSVCNPSLIQKPYQMPISLAQEPSVSYDQTLPFDVQNYVLNLLTCLLEDNLFRFAIRYLPSFLVEHPSWTCAQAVEISVWRSVLPTYHFPTTVPPILRTAQGRKYLERGLIDAVRIRNFAVHRQGCGNMEMISLARKAGVLFALLGEEIGRKKCQDLQAGILEWDRGDVDRVGWDERRARLERVLNSVAEKEVDEMEWNAVESVDLKDFQDHQGRYSTRNEGRSESEQDMEID